MYNFPIACVYRFSLSLVLIHPLKAIRTLEKKKKKKEKLKKNIIPFRQNILGSLMPFPESIQFFVLGASISYGKPPPLPPKKGGGVSTTGETLAKELYPEWSDFVFDRQPESFRSRRAHQWLSGDLTGDQCP